LSLVDNNLQCRNITLNPTSFCRIVHIVNIGRNKCDDALSGDISVELLLATAPEEQLRLGQQQPPDIFGGWEQNDSNLLIYLTGGRQLTGLLHHGCGYDNDTLKAPVWVGANLFTIAVFFSAFST